MYPLKDKGICTVCSWNQLYIFYFTGTKANKTDDNGSSRDKTKLSRRIYDSIRVTVTITPKKCLFSVCDERYL